MPTQEDDMIKDFITHLDAPKYENLFVMWNSDLKEQQHTKIKLECERIMKALQKHTGDFELFDSNITTEPFRK